MLHDFVGCVLVFLISTLDCFSLNVKTLIFTLILMGALKYLFRWVYYLTGS